MYGSCCGVNADVYSRNLFFYSDLPYDNLNYREATGVDLKAFRIGNGPNNVYQQINTPNLSSSTKRLGGVNPPVKDRDTGYLNEPVTNSICVLRYKAYIQGYYDRRPRDSMVIQLSGCLNVKLPGYKIQTPGERYRYIVVPAPPTPPRRNGDGFVFHRSDCGYPNVRMYSFGGDGPGSACGYWLDTRQNRNAYLNRFTNNVTRIPYSDADSVWYGISPSSSEYDKETKFINNLLNKIPQSSWNWSIPNIMGER
jgi:hypothetical protein